MNRQKAIEWFKEVEALDPGPYFSRKSPYGGYDSSEWEAKARRFAFAAEQAIRRTFPPRDPVIMRMNEILSAGIVKTIAHSGAVASLVALFYEARKILESDRFDSLIEGVRADTVSELIEQAEVMLANGWRAAAMVMAGGALESTLRHFCETQDPPIEVEGHGSIEKYNGAIAKRRKEGADIPITQDHTKAITTWGGLRNGAAHKPLEFEKDHSKESVRNTIEAIGLFLVFMRSR